MAVHNLGGSVIGLALVTKTIRFVKRKQCSLSLRSSLEARSTRNFAYHSHVKDTHSHPRKLNCFAFLPKGFRAKIETSKETSREKQNIQSCQNKRN